jgi:CrcB protein
LGTALRLGVTAVIPADGQLPLAVIVVNLSGAFVLAWLLETLVQRGPETAVGRGIRLGVGTGVLGGYTTYSALAVGADGLIATDNLTVGLLVAVPTVVAGVILAWLGAVVARAITPRGQGQ